MGFLSRLIGRKKASSATPFEMFLRAFADDPHLADQIIRDAKPPNRLMMALCLACFHGGYTITIAIREALANLPRIDTSTSLHPFPFDTVAQEIIAFVFFTAMAEHMSDGHDDKDDEDDDSETAEDVESEKFQALKKARYLADSLAGRYIENRPKNHFRNRILAYSWDSYKRKNLFEEAANHVLKALNQTAGYMPVDDLIKFAFVQQAIASDMLVAIKNGIDGLYLEWESNPESFGS